MTVEKPGFAMAIIENVAVQVGSRLRVDAADARRTVERARSGDRHHAAHRDRHQRTRAGHHRRSDARAAVERPRVFGAGAADDRRSAVGAQQQPGRHAARRRVQRERPSQHVQQLSDRRRRQQRVRHQQSGILQSGDAAGARRHLGVSGRHQQRQRRIRTRGGRHDQRGVSQRRQSVSRQRLGVRARYEDECGRLLQAGDRKADAEPQSVRRDVRRPDRQEQGILLRRLRRVPAGSQGHVHLEHRDARRSGRAF